MDVLVFVLEKLFCWLNDLLAFTGLFQFGILLLACHGNLLGRNGDSTIFK